MGILRKWSDGHVLNTDDRREDPLFYYLMRKEWTKAIGFQVLPLYEEATAEQVEISIFVKHRQSESALCEAERELMYVRSIPILAEFHRKWKRITVKGVNLQCIFKSGILITEMHRLGFEPIPGADPDEAVWSRA